MSWLTASLTPAPVCLRKASTAADARPTGLRDYLTGAHAALSRA